VLSCASLVGLLSQRRARNARPAAARVTSRRTPRWRACASGRPSRPGAAGRGAHRKIW